MIEFFVPMRRPPTITAQQQQVTCVYDKDAGKHIPHFFKPKELDQARARLRDHLAPWVPDKPYNTAIRLVVKWCWPTNGRYPHGTPKHTAPDTDNLQKMLKDVMEDLGFFTNDSRVASEIVEKFWADPPGLYICVEELVT